MCKCLWANVADEHVYHNDINTFHSSLNRNDRIVVLSTSLYARFFFIVIFNSRWITHFNRIKIHTQLWISYESNTNSMWILCEFYANPIYEFQYHEIIPKIFPLKFLSSFKIRISFLQQKKERKIIPNPRSDCYCSSISSFWLRNQKNHSRKWVNELTLPVHEMRFVCMIHLLYAAQSNSIGIFVVYLSFFLVSKFNFDNCRTLMQMPLRCEREFKANILFAFKWIFVNWQT